VINCSKCGKENQDHYKFCLGCGAELPKDKSPKPFKADTPPQGVAQQSAQAAPAPTVAPAAPAARPAAPPAQAAAASADRGCPQCGHPNPPNNRFCAACGYNLSAPSAQPAAAAPAAAPTQGGALLTALRADGSEAGSYRLPAQPTATVGRDTDSVFAGDSYLSPRHATFKQGPGQVSVRDEGSLNGVYVKLRPNEPWPMEPGNVFRIGQEIIRFEKLDRQPPSSDGVERFGSPSKGFIGRLALVIGRDTTGNAFPIPERGLHLGRERGDVLFSEDGYVSGLHCRVAPGQDGRVYLTDVGSSNGTFVRLSTEHALNPGEILLMGQQVFRVDF
jgi:pSer/pThr/pTyr-binding forkhead associated (FHA) protein